MGELVSLRKARKQAKREADAKSAAANRFSHGRSKSERTLDAARTDQRRRLLDAHKIDSGES
jgi:hypothetical protein